MTKEEVEKYAAFRAWKVVWLIIFIGIQLLTILITIITLADGEISGWLGIPAIIIERIVLKGIWNMGLYIIGVHNE